MTKICPAPLKAALLCCLLALAVAPAAAHAQSGSAGGSIGNDDKSISGSRSAAPERPSRQTRSAEEPRRAAPKRGGGGGGGGGNFDGAWIVVGVGTTCQGSATSAVVISSGKIIGEGIVSGSVSPSGAATSVSNANGIIITASGRMSGRSGSGSFRRSDGCVGRWTASKS